MEVIQLDDYFKDEQMRIQRLHAESPGSSLLKIADFYVLVDSEDVPRIEKLSWSVQVVSKSILNFMSRSGEKAQKKRILLGRFLMNPPEGQVVRKLEGSALFDFRKQALCVCTNNLKIAQQPKTKRGTSRFKGVSRDKSGKWRASIRPFGKSIYLGSYESEVDAARAYNQAALEHFGESAYLNKLD